jgi:hypothetical protein
MTIKEYASIACLEVGKEVPPISGGFVYNVKQTVRQRVSYSLRWAVSAAVLFAMRQ